MAEPSAMERFEEWAYDGSSISDAELREGIRLAVEAAKEIGALESMDDIHEGDVVTLGIYGGLGLYVINPLALEQDYD